MTQTAKLYGGSFYDLAAEEQLTEVVLEQMKEIAELFWDNPDYVSLLMQPAIPFEERKGLIDAAFGTQVERYLLNFIKLMCERNLLGEFCGCCDEFVRRYNMDHGIVEAVVTSAVALSKEQSDALINKLEQISGKRVHLKQMIDSTVLAGLRVEIDGKQLDGTVQGRLSDMAKKLNSVIC